MKKILLMFICLLTFISVNAQDSEPGDSIAFVSRVDGNSDIYLLELESGDIQNLTDNEAKDDSPAWSPDGQQLAFVSDRDGFSNIYILNMDDQTLNQITYFDYPYWIYSLIWSPDMSKIAFIGESGLGAVYVVDIATGSILDLMEDWEEFGHETAAAWVMGSQQVSLTKVNQNNYFDTNIYLVDIAEKNIIDFLATGGHDSNYSESPNGQYSAFITNGFEHTPTQILYITGSPADDHIPLVEQLKYDVFSYVWSPDSQKMAVINGFQITDNKHIAIIDIETLTVTYVTERAEFKSITWSPDSNQIAFILEADGQDNLIAMSIDGTNRRVLQENVTLPAWRPNFNSQEN